MSATREAPIRILKSDGHLSLTLANPSTSNALSPAMVEALITALSDIGGLRSCTIQGEGRNFCAGFDLSDIADLSDGDVLQMVHHAPFPVLALCQGRAVAAARKNMSN